MTNTQERFSSDVRSDMGARISQARETASQAGQQAYDAAKSAMNEMRGQGREIADRLSDQTGRSIETVREYVKEYPFRSLAAAVAAGLLFGYMRRRS